LLGAERVPSSIFASSTSTASAKGCSRAPDDAVPVISRGEGIDAEMYRFHGADVAFVMRMGFQGLHFIMVQNFMLASKVVIPKIPSIAGSASVSVAE
jgi:hypothetical protein